MGTGNAPTGWAVAISFVAGADSPLKTVVFYAGGGRFGGHGPGRVQTYSPEAMLPGGDPGTDTVWVKFGWPVGAGTAYGSRGRRTGRR